MADRAWRFRTTTGVATIRDDAITTRSTPRQFLAGQSVRWRHGSRRERVKVAGAVVGFLVSIVLLAYHLYLVVDAGFSWSWALALGTVGVLVYSLWNERVRRTTIPRSAISTVSLDADERRLTVTHETGDGPLSAFRDDVAETTMTLGTEDDLRRAREIFRLRGIALEPAPADPDETETTFRVLTRDGACFCERCRRQVSPSDRQCPACDYALRVETNVAE